MPITELALLRISAGLSYTDPSLHANLATARAAMEKFTSFPFHLFHCVEDPALIYLIGSWSSLAQHMESWIPSPENQALLQLMKDQVEVEWMFHVALDPTTLPINAPLLAIARHFVARDNKIKFEEVINGVKHRLELRIGSQELGKGGWKIEKDDDRVREEEWVLFSGWESVEKHMDFAETKEFKEYVRIIDLMEGSEIRYATRMSLD